MCFSNHNTTAFRCAGKWPCAFVPPEHLLCGSDSVWGQTHLRQDTAASQPHCMTRVHQAINILRNKSTLVPPAASPIKSFPPPARNVWLWKRGLFGRALMRAGGCGRAEPFPTVCPAGGEAGMSCFWGGCILTISSKYTPKSPTGNCI